MLADHFGPIKSLWQHPTSITLEGQSGVFAEHAETVAGMMLPHLSLTMSFGSNRQMQHAPVPLSLDQQIKMH